MARSTREIKVVENIPDNDPLARDKIIAQWIIRQQFDKYGDDSLAIAYPIWIRTKELESTGLSYEDAKNVAIKEHTEGQMA